MDAADDMWVAAPLSPPVAALPMQAGGAPGEPGSVGASMGAHRVRGDDEQKEISQRTCVNVVTIKDASGRVDE